MYLLAGCCCLLLTLSGYVWFGNGFARCLCQTGVTAGKGCGGVLWVGCYEIAEKVRNAGSRGNVQRFFGRGKELNRIDWAAAAAAAVAVAAVWQDGGSCWNKEEEAPWLF